MTSNAGWKRKRPLAWETMMSVMFVASAAGWLVYDERTGDVLSEMLYPTRAAILLRHV